MRNLNTLSLENNNLTTLPDSIGYLSSLQIFTITNNKLSHIPPSIGRISNLKEFFINQNNLAEIPPELGFLKKLEILNVSNNPLVALPDEVARLMVLRDLQCVNCTFEFGNLHQIRGGVPSLKELAARKISRHHMSIEQASASLQQYVASAHACTFCGGI